MEEDLEKQTVESENDKERAAVQEAPPDTGEVTPTVEVDSLMKELQECQTRAAEYLDGWQRAQAEFANYKKRIEREQAQMYQTTTGNVIRRYLEIVDDLERALKNRPKEGDGAIWADGLELIYRKLVSILEAEGLKVIEAQGQFFDPNLHEAVSHEEAPGRESGQIIEVTKQGYLLGERVLRPALVRVAK